MLASIIASIPLGINWFGTKAIILYVVIILAIIAVGVYARRGSVGR